IVQLLSTSQLCEIVPCIRLLPPFYLSAYVWRPAVPSFPTRRSSDLKVKPFASTTATAQPPRPSAIRAGRWLARQPSPGAYRARRSEEHTSELQSRVDLVCRLLLEK